MKPAPREANIDQRSVGRWLPSPASRAERGVQVAILVPWLLAIVGTVWFAGDLERISVSWPLHYWIAAQGIIGFFVLLAVLNNCAMRRLDARDAVETDRAGDGTGLHDP